MANFGQSTFVGSEVVIECGDKMSCCDREQAKAKTDGYNKEIAGDPGDPKSGGPMQISPGSGDLCTSKCTAQAEAWRSFREKMDNAGSAAERQQIAKDNAMSDCIGESVANSWESGRRTSRGLRVQMDHTVEVKWGGPASPDGLLALGSRVNNFFGSICKRTGDDMLKGTPPQEEISAVHFVCNPPCRPPKAADKNKNYSTGPAGKSPPAPVAGNPVRTYLAD